MYSIVIIYKERKKYPQVYCLQKNKCNTFVLYFYLIDQEREIIGLFVNLKRVHDKKDDKVSLLLLISIY